jgi:hypothetical protein
LTQTHKVEIVQHHTPYWSNRKSEKTVGPHSSEKGSG